jgi:hypothetical protein
MMKPHASVTASVTSCLVLALASLASCEDDDGPAADAGTPADSSPATDSGEAGSTTVAHTLFATEGQTLVSFDVATGSSRAGTITNLKGPTDLQVTDDGQVLVNLTDNNEILVVDGRSFREVGRIASSGLGATRPVHAFITPKIAGKQYWAANNDGAPGAAATNSVVFIDLVPGSATYLKKVGEIGLGIGHHKDAWSQGKARVSISNIADCGNVVQVIDYSNVAQPVLVKKWSAAEIDPARDCATGGAAPHGAAAAANGHGFHNLTGWGALLAVDQDADVPTVKLLPTRGTGAGYTRAGRDGRYVYSLQRTPREGDATRPGADCQIGQLVVVDSNTDTVAAEVPILLTGAACTSKLPAYATQAGPDHLSISKDGKVMFIATQAAAPMGGSDPAYSDQLVVFDLANPAAPVQGPSVTVGKHSGHRGLTISGDDKVLFVVNGLDKTVSQVDVAGRTVVRTISLRDTPSQVATWGSAEGPSIQTGPR